MHAPTDDIVAPSFFTYEVGAAPSVVYIHDLDHNKMLNPNGSQTKLVIYLIKFPPLTLIITLLYSSLGLPILKGTTNTLIFFLDVAGYHADPSIRDQWKALPAGVWHTYLTLS